MRWVKGQENVKGLKLSRVKRKPGGLYIFTIRRKGSSAGIPWYVGINKGKGQSSLYRESLTNDKLKKYARALAAENSGSAWLYFLRPGDRRSDDIDRLETFLIWLARQRNPHLLNDKKVRLSPMSLMRHLKEHKIVGVLPARKGKPSEATAQFRKMIGWERSMHVGASE